MEPPAIPQEPGASLITYPFRDSIYRGPDYRPPLQTAHVLYILGCCSTLCCARTQGTWCVAAHAFCDGRCIFCLHACSGLLRGSCLLCLNAPASAYQTAHGHVWGMNAVTAPTATYLCRGLCVESSYEILRCCRLPVYDAECLPEQPVQLVAGTSDLTAASYSEY